MRGHIAHPVGVFKSAVQVSLTGRDLQFIPCEAAAGTAMNFTEKVTDHHISGIECFLA